MPDDIIDFIEGSIRPRVQADGGEIAVAGADENGLRLVLMGECAVCPCAGNLREWVATQVRERFGAHMRVAFTSKKRYFQDK